jgi:hypothetical protein
MFRVAGLIRSSARQNIKIRKKKSLPGTPVHSRTSGGFRVIRFAVQNEKAYIGPIKFKKNSLFRRTPMNVNEFGGSIRQRLGMAYYPQRSFMGFTLKKLAAQRELPRQFSYEIRRYL